MGKKKKTSSNKSPQEIVEELKTCFLSLVDPPPDESRIELIAALRAFQRTEDDDYEGLETLARRLRVARTQLWDYLDLEREEVFDVYRDLQIKYDPPVVQELLTLECVYRTYLKQLSQEEGLLDQLLDLLNKLYSVPKDNPRVEAWIRQLSERHLMKNVLRVSMVSRLPHKEFPAPAETLALNITEGPMSSLVQEEESMIHHPSTILEGPTVVEAAQRFLAAPAPPNTTILVVGPSGSGKTHLCNEIYSAARSCAEVKVIRPKLPVDFMGARIGDAEHTLQCLFAAVSNKADDKCVVILDDVDLILGSGDESESPSHLRFRLDFISRLDQLSGCNALFICTSSTPLDDVLGRFDKMFPLQPPDREQRVMMIRSCLGITDLSEGIERALDTLTTCMLGRSRAEIAQYCRQAIQTALHSVVDFEGSAGKQKLLESMIAELSQLAPESLRSGVIDGFVDMTVMSAAELRTMNENLSLPLIGNGMEDAWRQLEALVVTPLCRSDALDRMLSGGHQESRRSFCGGALITGDPGTGKSTIALHAARVASMYLPSVKLIDVSCTSLVQKEVGGSERALRRLFTAVRAAAPCILLMDGIENIAAIRGKDNTTHGTMDRILSTLLTELDGVDTTSQKEGAKFAMIGITHQVSWIDAALRRPGRLEKTIELQKPNWEARKLIAMKELQQLDLEDSMNFEDLSCLIADHTNGKTAADIMALCEEARMASAKEAIRIIGSKVTDGSVEPELRREHFTSLFSRT
jgi:SpoVK/Ycf46/Vps4 family AAA+-type ATPase